MKTNKINWYQLFLYLMLTLLVVEVFVLIRENRLLRQLVENGAVEQVKAGSHFANIPVADIQGQPAEIDFQNVGQSTILLVFSTTCQYCTQNLANWENLYQQYKDEFHIVAISDSEPEETLRYIETHNIPYPVFFPRDKDFRKRYKLAGVPETLVINRENVIDKVWLGPLPQNYPDGLHQLIASR